MLIAQISIISFSMLCVIACALLCHRMLLEKATLNTDIHGMGLEMEAIKLRAERAELGVSQLRTKHYESLAIHLKEIETNYNSLKSQMDGLDESVSRVNNKLSSRSRAEKKVEREEDKLLPQENIIPLGAPPGGSDASEEPQLPKREFGRLP